MRFTGLSVISSFQRSHTASSDWKLAQTLQSVLVFFLFVFTNVLPGLFAPPRWHLRNQDLHVNRTRKSTLWVSRGSRCEDRCGAPWILAGVRGCEKLWTEAKPKPNKPAGFQFLRDMAKRSDKDLCKQALSCFIPGTGKKV